MAHMLTGDGKPATSTRRVPTTKAAAATKAAVEQAVALLRRRAAEFHAKAATVYDPRLADGYRQLARDLRKVAADDPTTPPTAAELRAMAAWFRARATDANRPVDQALIDGQIADRLEEQADALTPSPTPTP